jgi:hypothetical protein
LQRDFLVDNYLVDITYLQLAVLGQPSTNLLRPKWHREKELLLFQKMEPYRDKRFELSGSQHGYLLRCTDSGHIKNLHTASAKQYKIKKV